MKTAIIGASGFIGSYLYNLFSHNHEVIGTFNTRSRSGLQHLDIVVEKEVNDFFADNRPDVVILPASLTNVDWCENNREQTFSSNVLGMRNVLRQAVRLGSKLVYISTDYVFDGNSGPYSETDLPNPINFYGLTKLLAEHEVQALTPNHLIVRVTWVYGWEKASKNFVDSLVRMLKKGETRKVPTDQFGNPTYVQDLCKGIEALLRSDCTGIYNLVGGDNISRYDFALKIAQVFGLDKDLIIPLSTSELGQAARRPLKGGLLTDKIINHTGFRPITMQDGLLAMKDEELI